MFYTFSELESGRLRAEARDVPDEEWATTGGGFGVVNPVAEGQDTALQEEGSQGLFLGLAILPWIL